MSNHNPITTAGANNLPRRRSAFSGEPVGVTGIGDAKQAFALIIAIGGGGTIVISYDDGETWIEVDSGVPGDLNAVTTGDGTPENPYVIVGDGGVILVANPEDPTSWVLVNSGTTNDILGVIYSPECDVYVAVGEGGYIATSEDAQTWNTQTSGTVNALVEIVWNGLLFATVGDNGTILTAPCPGDTWTPRVSGTSEDLNDVVWNGELFVSVGENGVITTSPDGITWIVQDSGILEDLNGVFWNGEVFVAVGDNGTLLTSPDGLIWTPQDSGVTVDLYDGITPGGGVIIVVGGDPGNPVIIQSNDNGETWFPQDVPGGGPIVNIDIDVNVVIPVDITVPTFVAVGPGGVVITADVPDNWTVGVDPTPVDGTIVSIISTITGFIAVADDGTILTSNDGIDWTVVFTTPGNIPLTDIELAPDGTLVAVGDNGDIYASTNGGQTWELVDTPTDQNLNDVVEDCGVFTTVGDKGTIIRSTDGINWTNVLSPALLENPIPDLTAIAWNGLVFVAAGSGGYVLTSPDGLFWTIQPVSPNVRPSALVWNPNIGNFLMVGIGSNSHLLAADYQTWNTQPTGFTGDIHAAVFDNRQFTIAGDGGELATSMDGVDWTLQVSGTAVDITALANRVNLSGETCPEETPTLISSPVVTVGAGGAVFVSVDGGQTWKPVADTGTIEDLYAIALDPECGYFAVGDSGTIIQSFDLGNWQTIAVPTADLLISVAFVKGVLTVETSATPSVGYTSTDCGKTWTERCLPITNPINDVGVTPTGNLVAVADNGEIITSTDGGVTWIDQTSNFPGTGPISNVVVNDDGKVIAVDDSGDIFISNDEGITWVTVTPTGPFDTATAVEILWIPELNIFVASDSTGGIFVSLDGEDWLDRTPDGGLPNPFTGGAWDGDEFVLIFGGTGNSDVRTSTGAEWVIDLGNASPDNRLDIIPTVSTAPIVDSITLFADAVGSHIEIVWSSLPGETYELSRSLNIGGAVYNDSFRTGRYLLL